MREAPGLEILPHPLAQPPDELAWLQQALEGWSRAVVWRSQPALVVPVSYQANGRLPVVGAEFAARGWPVWVRRSGGGVVPLDPGVLNLTLATATPGPGHGGMERVYHALCTLLAQGLRRLGIKAQALPVAGSYCDGRFNLAVVEDGVACKLAGTAQYWRHGDGRDGVLAHATLLVDTDVARLTAQANAFEAALGSPRRYRASALTQVAQQWPMRTPGDASGGDLLQRTQQALVAEFQSSELWAGLCATCLGPDQELRLARGNT